jgi:hypothetical protein
MRSCRHRLGAEAREQFGGLAALQLARRGLGYAARRRTSTARALCPTAWLTRRAISARMRSASTGSVASFDSASTANPPAVAGVDADGNRVAGPHAGNGAGRAFDIGRVDVVACDDDHVLGAAADVQPAVFVEVAEVAGM